MISEVKSFGRKEIFNNYHTRTNPFIIITTKIEVTDIVNFCKENNKSFYATMGYLITKTVNGIGAFKYRYDKEKIYYCDKVNSNYTQMYDEDGIGYFDVSFNEKYSEYINNYENTYINFIKTKKSAEINLDVIWLSCTPWFSFSSLIPPFDKEISIPQFIWDKYERLDNKYYINLMVMVHHGFADGNHIGRFLYDLKVNVNKFVL